jgi:hypothetical protein
MGHERTIALNGNHLEIVKYAHPHDPNFETVRDNLLYLMEKILGEMEKKATTGFEPKPIEEQRPIAEYHEELIVEENPEEAEVDELANYFADATISQNMRYHQ